MDREEANFQANLPVSFSGMEYSLDQLQLLKSRTDESSDFMLNPPPISSSGFCHSIDKLSFSEVMQFADYGPKLGSHQTKISNQENVLDPVYMLKFPVLGEKLQGHEEEEGEEGLVCENTSGQLQFVESSEFLRDSNTSVEPTKNRRKRPRTIKTSEEVESQRMTHIAVERNRRKQMNEHLRVLRSLMPSSYVQRGDQASIIGGAIEFVRELEQLLQCLESQKRRRIFGDAPRCLESPPLSIQQQQTPPFFLPQNDLKLLDFDTPLREETAENKSCLADIEVKLLGIDAIIKILSQRRPGQLLKTIAALEDLQLNILHTNITTIEQTVLYSFNVKIMGDSRFTAENIANSVQQIFNFIHASTM